MPLSRGIGSRKGSSPPERACLGPPLVELGNTRYQHTRFLTITPAARTASARAHHLNGRQTAENRKEEAIPLEFAIQFNRGTRCRFLQLHSSELDQLSEEGWQAMATLQTGLKWPVYARGLSKRGLGMQLILTLRDGAH